MKYVVCLLLTPDLSRVLLVEKNKSAFAGKWNGIGGELEDGEGVYACAHRKITEETGVSKIKSLTYLGMLTLPEDCKHPDDESAELHWFVGVLPDDNSFRECTDTNERLGLFYIDVILHQTLDQLEYLAGDGDILYFLNLAMKHLPGVSHSD